MFLNYSTDKEEALVKFPISDSNIRYDNITDQVKGIVRIASLNKGLKAKLFI